MKYYKVTDHVDNRPLTIRANTDNEARRIFASKIGYSGNLNYLLSRLHVPKKRVRKSKRLLSKSDYMKLSKRGRYAVSSLFRNK